MIVLLSETGLSFLNNRTAVSLFQKQPIKLIIILLLFTVWIYQAYQALNIYHDRYFKVVQ